MKLTERQRKHLRGLAHGLRPCLTVGGAGLSESVLAELETQLAHHELIKVKLRTGDRRARQAAIAEMTERSQAECVLRIGNVAVLYHRRAAEPGIILP